MNSWWCAYGAIEALHGVSLSVGLGQIVTLIGANGAGKSSLLRAISGLIPAASGTIRLESGEAGGRGVFLNRTAAHRIVALGVSHVPEGRGIFSQMTVQENLDLGAYLRRDTTRMAAGFGARVYAVSSHQGTANADGGDDVRWGAADVGDWAGADVAAKGVVVG